MYTFQKCHDQPEHLFGQIILKKVILVSASRQIVHFILILYKNIVSKPQNTKKIKDKSFWPKNQRKIDNINQNIRLLSQIIRFRILLLLLLSFIIFNREKKKEKIKSKVKL